MNKSSKLIAILGLFTALSTHANNIRSDIEKNMYGCYDTVIFNNSNDRRAVVASIGVTTTQTAATTQATRMSRQLARVNASTSKPTSLPT